MTDAIAVLALDATDTDYVERFGCDNIALDTHTQMQSVAYGHDYPMTWEVWPAIATGRHPRETATVEMEWDNPAFRLAQKVTTHFPMGWRKTLGKPFREEHVNGFKQVKVSDVFDATPNWPGVSEARDLKESWEISRRAAEGRKNREETYDLLVEQFGAQLGWLSSAAKRHGGVVGIHSHILDVIGHLYADDEDVHERYYQTANAMIGEYLSDVENLLILSDHGMQTAFNGDVEPAQHSWRAIAATNMDATPPKHVLDVRDWLEERAVSYDHDDDANRDEQAIQRLKDLGYI